MVVGAPGLWVVEGVDSRSKADALNKAVKNLEMPKKLRVFLQINASGEES